MVERVWVARVNRRDTEAVVEKVCGSEGVDRGMIVIGGGRVARFSSGSFTGESCKIFLRLSIVRGASSEDGEDDGVDSS